MACSTNRLLSVALILAWLAPSAGALGLGLHILTEHDGAPTGEHQAEIADLALATAHAHHHGLGTAPHHHHRAFLGATTPLIQAAPSFLATLPAAPMGWVAPAARSTMDRAPRRDSPRPLFTAFCSLLI